MADKKEKPDLERYTRTVALKDGSVLHLRTITTDDEDRLMSFFLRLSGRTIYLRFHHVLTNLSRRAEMQGVTIQKMLSGGVELIVGVTQDKFFGPLIMFGLGGIYTELFKDVDFRIHPLTDYDAREMLASFKAHKLLYGWRGAPPSDTASIEDLLLRVSAMIEDIPEIQELDLNPLIAMPKGQGCVVADARISISPVSV